MFRRLVFDSRLATAATFAAPVTRIVLILLFGASAMLMATPAAAQSPRVLTLDEALRLAGATSENVTLAEAAIARAEGDRLRARGLTHPQLSASASYDRALASEFSGI